MMEYQRTIRERQLERAKKLLRLKDPEKIKKGPNDIRRFLKNTSSDTANYVLDMDKIHEEENTMDSMPSQRTLTIQPKTS